MKATDRGIFLQRTPYSDSSLIVTFFMERGGLQKFVFRGGKKKAHQIYPLSISELTYYGRNDSELLNLVSVESLKPQQFQFDPLRGTVAFFMAETLRKCLAPGQPDKSFFDFAETWIEALDTRKNLALFPLEFLIECSGAMGFRPLCEENNDLLFNVDAGVFQKTSGVSERTFGGDSALLIRNILTGENNPTATRACREEALDIMLMYFSIHVPRFDRLESYEILREVLHA